MGGLPGTTDKLDARRGRSLNEPPEAPLWDQVLDQFGVAIRQGFGTCVFTKGPAS